MRPSALLLLVGWASPATVPPATAELAGVEVFAEFPRYLQVAGEQVEIAFDNRGDDDLWIAEVSVRVDGFAPVDADGRPALVRAGQRVDIKAGFGAIDCSVEPATAVVTATVNTGAEPTRGGPTTISIEPGPFLDIHADVCGARAVLEAVDLSWSQTFERSGEVITTTLDVTAVGDASATVESMRGSVIFAVAPVEPIDPLATVGPGGSAAQIPIAIRVQRCDAHAVIESKKSFQLSLWVSTGDLVDQHLTLEPIGGLRAAMDQLVQDCLTATTTTTTD